MGEAPVFVLHRFWLLTRTLCTLSHPKVSTAVEPSDRASWIGNATLFRISPERRTGAWRGLFPLPAGAVFGVLDHDSSRRQLFADAVAAGEIPRPASLLPLRQQGVDLLVAERIRGHKFGRRLAASSFLLRPFERATGNLRIAIFENGKDLIEPAKRLQDGGDVAGIELAGVGSHISRPAPGRRSLPVPPRY